MSARPLLLVVEDDADAREALTIFLRENAYDVVAARDGRDALDVLRAGVRPALILLDVVLPGMNGFEFRQRQLAEPELASIPVAVLSADDGAVRARTLGALGFFVKPVDFDALLRKLALWCPQRPAAP